MSGPDEAPLRVLFVCTANICRSPTMHVLARRATSGRSDLMFASAGTRSGGGHPMDQDMATAIGVGPDTEAFRSTRLTAELLADADLVLTAEAAHRSQILGDQPRLVRRTFTLGQFVEAVRRAPSGLDRSALLRRISGDRGHADAALDVPDPYRQGPEAAAACAGRIDGLLSVMLAALTDD